MELKWDDSVIRFLNGKMVMENELVFYIIMFVGFLKEFFGEMIVLDFIESKMNLIKLELLLFYNFSFIGIEVFGNYIFNEVL